MFYMYGEYHVSWRFWIASGILLIFTCSSMNAEILEEMLPEIVEVQSTFNDHYKKLHHDMDWE